jgi:hypothetical protein
LLGDSPRRVQPPACADLGRTRQAAREHLGILAVEAGVSGNRVGDGLDRALKRPIDPLANGRLVAQIGFEDQPERAPRLIDEVK